MDENELSALAVLAESIASDPSQALALVEFTQIGSGEEGGRRQPLKPHVLAAFTGAIHSEDFKSALANLQTALQEMVVDRPGGRRSTLALSDLIAIGQRLIRSDSQPGQLAGVALLWGVQNQLLSESRFSGSSASTKELLRVIAESVRTRYFPAREG